MALKEFIAKIAGSGLAWQNRFAVEITGPVSSTGPHPGSFDINLLAESVQMPGQNIRTTEDDLRFGPARDHAQAFTYGDISMTFICTPGMPEKLYFEDWQKLIVSKGNNEWQAKFYKEYIGQIKIYQLDRTDGENYIVTVHEAFPKTINAQEFSLSSTDAYQTVGIEFAYRWWESESVPGPTPSWTSAPVDTFDAFSGGRGSRESRAVDNFNTWQMKPGQGTFQGEGDGTSPPGTNPEHPGTPIR